MALIEDLLGSSRPARFEVLPETGGETAQTALMRSVFPAVQDPLSSQAGNVGRSGAEGFSSQPQQLQDFARNFFAASPTTPGQAAQQTIGAVSPALTRNYNENLAPNLLSSFQQFGAGRSGQGPAELSNLFRRNVSDPLAEAAAGSSVGQAQHNDTFRGQQDLRAATFGTPNDQAITQLLGQALGIKPPDQSIIGLPGEAGGSLTGSIDDMLMASVLGSVLGGGGGADGETGLLTRAITSAISGKSYDPLNPSSDPQNSILSTLAAKFLPKDLIQKGLSYVGKDDLSLLNPADPQFQDNQVTDNVGTGPGYEPGRTDVYGGDTMPADNPVYDLAGDSNWWESDPVGDLMFDDFQDGNPIGGYDGEMASLGGEGSEGFWDGVFA